VAQRGGDAPHRVPTGRCDRTTVGRVRRPLGEEPPEIDGVTLHQEDTREIAESWFVVFDGAGDPLDACALLAEERGDTDERLFYGFWTYDPAIVDDILAHLDQRYTITV
jgi:hypothetical protein